MIDRSIRQVDDVIPTIPPLHVGGATLLCIYHQQCVCSSRPTPKTPCHTPLPRPFLAAFHSTYQLGKVIGEGAFSQVRSATVTRSGPDKGVQVAVKCIERTNLPKEDEEDLLEEVRNIYEVHMYVQVWSNPVGGVAP